MSGRKIIHIDMDMFFVAIEIRDRPELKNLPVAVGGSRDRRGVISTANYIARKFGVKSAVSTSKALKLCPDLIVLPTDIKKYQMISKQIFQIFRRYTDQIEGVSFDEAFLDVSESLWFEGSATRLAEKIRNDILKELNLTASAGVSSNKLLAKLASEKAKPDGIFVIPPTKISAFIREVSVAKIWGIGKVMTSKMNSLGIYKCEDIQRLGKVEMARHFGRSGEQWYQFSLGIDERPLKTNFKRKSLSVERTFASDLSEMVKIEKEFSLLVDEFFLRWTNFTHTHPEVKMIGFNCKIRLDNFKSHSFEKRGHTINRDLFLSSIFQLISIHNRPIRLLGIGVLLDWPDQGENLQLNFLDQIS
jgi:DNA polymerase IV